MASFHSEIYITQMRIVDLRNGNTAQNLSMMTWAPTVYKGIWVLTTMNEFPHSRKNESTTSRASMEIARMLILVHLAQVSIWNNPKTVLRTNSYSSEPYRIYTMILYDNKPYTLRSASLVTDLFCYVRAISRTFRLQLITLQICNY